ncbi:MAG: hypothetical protein KGL39_10075 [Patescibacteria group bacterium]|nr:hypothetical protein [Patescibacteria group bacterium]
MTRTPNFGWSYPPGCSERDLDPVNEDERTERELDAADHERDVMEDEPKASHD